MDQPKKQDQKCHSNSHHVYPRSRVPRGYREKLLGKWIVINVTVRAHNYFHAIFGNRIPEEQIEHLSKMCDNDGILNINIYATSKRCFDELFKGKINFGDMVKVLKQWDLSEEIKASHSVKLSEVRRVLNNEISGGMCIRKFKLN